MRKCFYAFLFFFCFINSQPFAQSGDYISNDVFDSVVRIQGANYREKGTGFIVVSGDTSIGLNYFLITNKHIIGKWSPGEPFIPDSIIQVIVYTHDSINPYYPYPVHIFDNGKLNSSIRLHPDPKVDVVAINLGSVFRNFMSNEICRMKCFQVSDLIPLNDLNRTIDCYTGSRVYSVGFPAKKYSLQNGRPIAKSLTIASELNADSRFNWVYKGRDTLSHTIVSANKVFLVDGLLYHGSSGSPIVFPWTSINQNQKPYDDKALGKRDYIIGIVSSGNLEEGIAFIFSADNVLDLLK